VQFWTTSTSVAQQVIWHCLNYGLDRGAGSASVADLGKYTWQDVLTVAKRLAARPDPEDFAGAYKRLASLPAVRP
jgi:hypothetical protein